MSDPTPYPLPSPYPHGLAVLRAVAGYPPRPPGATDGEWIAALLVEVAEDGRHRFAASEERALSAAAHAMLSWHGVADSYDSGDIWGSLMAVGFAACDEATRRGIPVPAELEYRPAMGGPHEVDPDDFHEVEAAELADDVLASLLVAIGPVLDATRAAGLDY